MKKNILALCTLLLIGCSEKRAPAQANIALLPYKGFGTKECSVVKNAVLQCYGAKVTIFPPKPLPEAAFINVKSPRYRADSLLHIQQRSLPKGVDYVIGLTHSDISFTKTNTFGAVKSPAWKYADFGIMGLGKCPGPVCVVSDFRLKHKDKSVQNQRLAKVAIHELGHNLGLPHCPDKKCVMTDAVERVSTIDNARAELCNDCKKKIGL